MSIEASTDPPPPNGRVAEVKQDCLWCSREDNRAMGRMDFSNARRTDSLRSWFVLLSACGMMTAAALLYGCHLKEEQGQGPTERVSIANANAAQANGGSGDGTRLVVGIPESTSQRPGMSADGRYVVFDSVATNLVPGIATNGRRQVYLRDRQTNLTEMISVNIQGTAGGNSDSYAPVVSDDGQTVVFESLATDLVFGIVDTNQASDIFLRTRATRLTERVSQFENGTQGICGGGSGCASYEPAINADASVIAFGSTARLVIDDIDNQADIYVLQRSGTVSLQRATPTAVFSTPPPSQGNPSVSGDGRFVAFASTSTQLANVTSVNTLDSVADIFLYDVQARTSRKVTVPFSGAPANGNSYWPSVSGDGRFVAFWSNATNLTATFPKTTNTADVFVADMQTQVPTIIRISLGLNNQQGNGESQYPSISRDGTFVAFVSRANNLDTPATDTNSLFDVYRSERACSPCNTKRVTVAIAGRDVDRDSAAPVISSDGRTIAFYSDATTLVPADTNGVRDAFLRTLP